MKTEARFCRRLQLASALILAASSVALAAPNGGYRINNIASDTPGMGARTDARVVNPWGMFVESQGNRLFVAENGTGLITIHPLDGTASRQSIVVPPPAGGTNTAKPTGLVQNKKGNFILSMDVSTNRTRNARAFLLFVTEDGTIGGWSQDLSRTNAIIKVDNSGAGAVYKSAALVESPTNTSLYAANFRAGIIEVYDTNFTLVQTFSNPSIPSGFAPFGMSIIQQKLFVTYAKQLAPDNADDEAGIGNGFVDIFNLNGTLARTFASNGPLNSPWGVTLAPRTFGKFSGTLLVGNFGDGLISSYNLMTGEFLGTLADANGGPLTINGLWSLVPNRQPDAVNFDYEATRIFYTAGPNGEANGVIGFIRPIVPSVRPVR